VRTPSPRARAWARSPTPPTCRQRRADRIAPVPEHDMVGRDGPEHPVRTCVGCRARAAKADLVRLVNDHGRVTPDTPGGLPGTGAVSNWRKPVEPARGLFAPRAPGEPARGTTHAWRLSSARTRVTHRVTNPVRVGMSGPVPGLS